MVEVEWGGGRRRLVYGEGMTDNIEGGEVTLSLKGKLQEGSEFMRKREEE